jgi:hypothetical protein
MTIAEGVQGRVVYKFYSSAAISSTSEPVAATDPAATGGQILRRVSSSLNLQRDSYRSNERRSDRQIAGFRLGTKRGQGSISGELSPATYFALIEAAHRHTSVASISKSNTELTSVTSNAGTSTFIFAGGNPVTEGFRVGDIVRFASLAATANNGINFMITEFSTANNRTMHVYPAPVTDAVADSTFTVVRPGKNTMIPSTGHVSRKIAIEHWNEDIDVAELFTEGRIAGYRLSVPASGLATFETTLGFRNSVLSSGGSAPFFTAPTAATSGNICASVNGLLRIGGTAVGVATGIEISCMAELGMEPVINPNNLVPDIFLGPSIVEGTVSCFFEDSSLVSAFLNETESNILLQLGNSSSTSGDLITIYLPRLIFSGADRPMDGDGGQTISLPFQALKYEGAAAGVEQTTIRIHDTAAA